MRCLSFSLVAVFLGSSTGAQVPAALPDACILQASSTIISVVICEPGASDDTLRAAGTAACAERRPCGAWFWEDAAAAPQEAPANHDGLTQDQITASRGVWVAERDVMISIAPAE